MRIAFVSQSFDRVLPPSQTSVGICTYGLANALSADCELFVYGLKDRHPDFVRTGPNNVSYFFVPATGTDRFLYFARSKLSKVIDLRSPFSTSSLMFPGYGHRVARELQKHCCDVIHIQQCSQYAPAIRELNPNAKIVLHLHAPWYSQTDSETLAARLQSVDLVTGVSDFVCSRVTRRFPMIAGRCETVHNGVDASDFKAERIYLSEPEEKRILFIGAVSPHSGVHVLLEAFRIVVRRFPNVKLDIVGPPGTYPIEEIFDSQDRESIQAVSGFYTKRPLSRLRAKLSAEASNPTSYLSMLKAQLSPAIAKKVNFRGAIGTRSELVKQYYEADVFAFPSVCEHGFGLPALEAMAAGTPVVASRSGALPETVMDQQTGFLVTKNDAEELAESLLTLLENDALRQSIGRAARQRALTRFTWASAAQKTYGLYQNLLQIEDSRVSYASSRS